MKQIIIDLQGFTIEKNRFLPKELAAYDGKKIAHYLFKQPFDLNQLPPDLIKQATFLMHNEHCIPWYGGFTPLHKISDIIKGLTELADFVYVQKGLKAEYIKKYSLKPVIEVGEEHSLQKTEPECFFHNNSFCYCALSNVRNIFNNFIMV